MSCQAVYLPVDKDAELALIQAFEPHQTFPMTEANVALAGG
ncbi:MAG: hypothetical protein ACRDOI_41085 [Trebonia sp.]